MKTLNVDQIINLQWDATEEGRDTDPARHVYKVTKVTNSVRPYVGYVMNHDEIADLCDNPDWRVVIV